MPKVWAWFSPAGGKGQSTFCMHFGAALAAKGGRVVLIDASHYHPSLDVLCGVSESVIYTVSDVANGSLASSRAMLSVALPSPSGKENVRFSLLPSYALEPLAGGYLRRAVQAIREEAIADYIIIDAHASLYDEVAHVADECFVLTDASLCSLRAAEAFANGKEKITKFFLMRAPLTVEKIRQEPALLDMIDSVKLAMGGIVPYEPLLSLGVPLCAKRYRKTAYMRAVHNIASRMIGENVPLLQGVPLDGITRRTYFERVSNKNSNGKFID